MLQFFGFTLLGCILLAPFVAIEKWFGGKDHFPYISFLIGFAFYSTEMEASGIVDFLGNAVFFMALGPMVLGEMFWTLLFGF